MWAALVAAARCARGLRSLNIMHPRSMMSDAFTVLSIPEVEISATRKHSILKYSHINIFVHKIVIVLFNILSLSFYFRVSLGRVLIKGLTVKISRTAIQT